jgi:hypothetical protein
MGSRGDPESYIRTTMIGAISKIENKFGSFWGFSKSPEERTENQTKLYELFRELREEILDLGNEQIRKCRKNNGN